MTPYFLIICTLFGFAMLLFTLITSGKVLDLLTAALYGCVATLIHNHYGNSANGIILSLGVFTLALLSFSFWQQHKTQEKMIVGIPFPAVVVIVYLMVLLTMLSYWFR